MLRDRLAELLAPVVADKGCELWEVEYRSGAGGGLLRLYLDAPEGITIEDCERVSRAVSVVLDEADPIPGEYTLEVSSPGLDRPLRTREHFLRFIGETVRVELSHPVAGRKRFQGVLLAVGEQTLTVQVEDAHELPIDEIHRARLVPQL